MATQIIKRVTDDLDGSGDAETVAFSYGGKSLEIDLNKKNRSAFDKAIKPYLDAARTVGRAPAKTSSVRGRSKSSGTDLGVVRAWAAENGYEVSARGRIAAEVMDAYNAAQG